MAQMIAKSTVLDLFFPMTLQLEDTHPSTAATPNEAAFRLRRGLIASQEQDRPPLISLAMRWLFAILAWLLTSLTQVNLFKLGGGEARAAAAYSGPCDVIAHGCAEAYSVTRAMTVNYSGPLFQLYNGTATLDIGQTSNHTANMSTWAAFCGGTMTTVEGIATSSTCVYSKLYGEIQAHNTLVPSVFGNSGYGGTPNCSTDSPYLCAAPFAIEVATGLPILRTPPPPAGSPAGTPVPQYTIAGDAVAVGITGGISAVSVVYNGKPVTSQLYCCGVFGITHRYNAGDVLGTDFMVALGYGRPGSNNLVLCATETTYCAGAEAESINDLADYGPAPVTNAIVAIVHTAASAPNAHDDSVIGYLNGKLLFTHHPPLISVVFPNAYVKTGTAIHLGGGGDLSVPDPVIMREGLIINAAMSPRDHIAAFRNMTAFYRGLSFAFQ